MKTSNNLLKAVLVSGVRKLSLAFVALKLGEFPLFDSFFRFFAFWLKQFLGLSQFLAF